MTLHVRRAAILTGLVLLLQLPWMATSCSSAETHPGPDAGTGAGGSGGAGSGGSVADAGPDVLMPPPITRTEDEAALAPKREACAFKAGAWPAETIGKDYPVGKDIPINHVIVIMQENRSFDHYLGRLVPQGYYKPGDFTTPTSSGFTHHDELDVPPAGWSNPDGEGGTVVPHPDDEYCYGVNHSWDAMHDDYDDGKLDHFVTQNNPNGQRTFFYQDDTVIPFYYALANTFAVGDRYFASVLSSTWPNRYFLMAGTSFGIGDNSFATNDTADHPAPQIFSLLESAGRTWKDYTDGPHMLAFFPFFGWRSESLANYGDIPCALLGDIKNNTLPDVAFVMGNEVTATSDEGPSALPGIGGQLVETILRTLFASPAWKDTAVFITYDENGGLADHVPPPPACKPDDLTPHDGKNNPLPGAFDRYGFRVPFIVVSPYARAHFASHTVHDHTAITRFIEARFGLPALSARDANATPPMEMFDFENPPFMTPPDLKAHTEVPQAILDQCGQKLAPLTCSH
ncbi:Acid phosphatase [Minicystis rosea]|nr:Acid phosphatase [Minicystis rosea]